MIPLIPNTLALVSWVFRGVKSAAAKGAAEIMEMVVNAMLAATGYLFATVWNWIDSATTPDVLAPWFEGGPFAMIMRLAAMVLFAAVMFSVMHAIWNRDIGELHHALLNEFPKALWNLSTLLLYTTIALGLADAITIWFLSAGGDGATMFASRMINLDQGFDLGFGAPMVFLMAVMMTFGIVIVAIMLFVRNGLVYLFVCVTAIAKAGDVAQPLRGGGGRAARLLWGIIAMKPLIALCFTIGGFALGGAAPAGSADAVPEPGVVEVEVVDPDADAADSAIAEANGSDLGAVTTDLFAGMAVVALAAFAPFSVMALFPFEGTEAAVGMGAELSGKATQTAQKGAAAGAAAVSGGATLPASAAAAASDGGGGGPGGEAGTAAAGKAAA